MPLKNPRWERFALFAAQGSTLDEAYKEAGYKSNRGNAGALAMRPEVKERIRQINTEMTETARKAQQITKEKLIGWHHEIRQQGMASGQLAPAGTAIKEISILTGHRIERAEVGAPGEYDALSDEELERQLMERLAKLGFARVDALVDFSPSETDAEDAGAPPDLTR
jgi:hypothetical protein